MIDGGIEVMHLPTTEDFLKTLSVHAGPDAPGSQWGYFPGACGQRLTEEMVKAAGAPDSAMRWIGKKVFDGNGLIEWMTDKPLAAPLHERLQTHYDDWCLGHIGDVIEEMVQLPAGAVFRTDAQGRFTDVGYLYRQTGDGPLDWDIFVCNNYNEGLCLKPMDNSWTHWGLSSIVLRYNLPGPFTRDLAPPPAGAPYGIVQSSVLNFRAQPGGPPLITSLPNGTVVQLTGQVEGDWTQSIINGTRGWSFSIFIEKHQ